MSPLYIYVERCMLTNVFKICILRKTREIQEELSDNLSEHVQISMI